MSNNPKLLLAANYLQKRRINHICNESVGIPLNEIIILNSPLLNDTDFACFNDTSGGTFQLDIEYKSNYLRLSAPGNSSIDTYSLDTVFYGNK